MTEEAGAKAGETGARPPIQVQTGDIEVAKLQLAARWAELATATSDIDAWLSAFNTAYKSIDDTIRL